MKMICVPSSLLGGFPMSSSCSALSTARPEVFGPVTWNVLHTLAQQFPDRPDPTQRQACMGFVASLPYMLPESASAASFQRYSVDYPGSLENVCQSGPELRKFFCRAHNQVNRTRGKPVLECRPETLEAMYGTMPVCLPSP